MGLLIARTICQLLGRERQHHNPSLILMVSPNLLLIYSILEVLVDRQYLSDVFRLKFQVKKKAKCLLVPSLSITSLEFILKVSILIFAKVFLMNQRKMY